MNTLENLYVTISYYWNFGTRILANGEENRAVPQPKNSKNHQGAEPTAAHLPTA
jgi:hypothetical protein